MKKIISTLMIMALLISACAAVMAVPASAADAMAYIGGIEKTVYRVVTAPTVDGTITAGEYGANENLFVASEWTNGGAKNGGTVRNLTSNEVTAFYAAWTPDGVYVALQFKVAGWNCVATDTSGKTVDFSESSEYQMVQNTIGADYGSVVSGNDKGEVAWNQIINDVNGHTGSVNLKEEKLVYNSAAGTVTMEFVLAPGSVISGSDVLVNGAAFNMTVGVWASANANDASADAGANSQKRMIFGGNNSGFIKSHDSSGGAHTWGVNGNTEGMPKFTLATQSCGASHAADETVEAVPATCTTVGYTAGTRCSACYTTTSGCEKVEIDLTNHGDATLDDVEAVAATCTEDGHEAGKKCTACKGWVTGAVVNATGHTLIDVEKVDATCQKKGTEAGKMCSVCGEKTEGFDKIDKVAHSYADGKCTMCQAADPNPAPATDTAAPAEEKSGCSSMLGIGGIAAVVVTAVSTLGIGYVSKKR